MNPIHAMAASKFSSWIYTCDPHDPMLFLVCVGEYAAGLSGISPSTHRGFHAVLNPVWNEGYEQGGGAGRQPALARVPPTKYAPYTIFSQNTGNHMTKRPLSEYMTEARLRKAQTIRELGHKVDDLAEHASQISKQLPPWTPDMSQRYALLKHSQFLYSIGILAHKLSTALITLHLAPQDIPHNITAYYASLYNTPHHTANSHHFPQI